MIFRLTAVAFLLSFGGGVLAQEAVSLRPNDPMYRAMGQQIYGENCAGCHGANLQGQENWRVRKADGRLRAPPHDQTGHTWHHADSQLFRMTKYGPAESAGGSNQSDMPAFADILSDGQIIAVLSYIKSRWPAELRASQDRTNRRR